MEYLYNNKLISPSLDQIHIDINDSLMTDKSIEWCRWDEGIQILKIVFTNELSTNNKSILDSIVDNNS